MIAGTGRLTTQAEALNQGQVTLTVLTGQVVQQFAALVYHADQATTAVVILLVLFEVTLQVIDIVGQQGNLNFR